VSELVVGTIITILIALTAYFFQKWLAEVEEKFQDIKKSVSSLKDNFETLSDSVKGLRLQLMGDIKKLPELHALSVRLEAIETLTKEFHAGINSKTQEIKETHGNIIIMHRKINEQDKKMMTLFKVVQRLALQSGSRPPSED